MKYRENNNEGISVLVGVEDDEGLNIGDKSMKGRHPSTPSPGSVAQGPITGFAINSNNETSNGIMP